MADKEPAKDTIKAQEVILQVSPRSMGPHALFDAPEPITADNVGLYRSSAADIAATSAELRRLGLRVLVEGETTISAAATPKQAEELFGVKLRKEKREIHPLRELEFFAPETEERSDHVLLQAPGEHLAPLIEGIAIARPPELFEAALPPVAPVDPAAYRYLHVPDDVAVVIRAARAHRLGATGQGVVVAMIDSGHYPHPFFNQHGYRVLSVLLGPGTSDPGQDTLGHGTGESANIFAAAPDIQLRPVKGLADPTGDFAVAVGSTPKPGVISNSWGYDIDHPGASLNPYLLTLQAAVANAVASGIVVLFSGGNGQKGFPACHPDVVAVGGVHVKHPSGDLEASSYASSFDSSLYPGRHVPDLCGITGKAVNIGGGAKAPSHLLPVQPGAQLDSILPSTGGGNDGWGLFSGTSAACPLVAGVAALMRAKDPSKTPKQIKDALIKSAMDVKAGTTAHGDTAAAGWDKATGAGLVDAKYAYLITMGDLAERFFSAPPSEKLRMVESGEMLELGAGFAEDIVTTLRSR
jgi:subtilisin family serine protease